MHKKLSRYSWVRYPRVDSPMIIYNGNAIGSALRLTEQADGLAGCALLVITNNNITTILPTSSLYSNRAY